MIRGTSITVLRPTSAETDRLGNAVPGGYVAETVENVLIAEPSTEEMESDRPFGTVRTATLHIPKTYQKGLEGCIVQLPGVWFREGGYHVVGDPIPYMEENTPTDWWCPVGVRSANG